MPPYGFGLVGCGMISRFHAAAIDAIPNAKLVAVNDVAEAAARRFGEEFGVDWHTDLDDMLARDDVDVVCVCTPSGFHRNAAVAAADAGKHVVVEKPLDITLAKCDAIIDAAERNNVKLSGIFPSRFFPCNQLVKKAVDEGRFGRITLGDVYTKWWRTQEYYDGGGWRGTWRLDGGGALMNQGVHAIDLLLWIMGPAESVQAFTTCRCHECIEVEDTAVACVRFKSGALGVIEGATSVYPGMPKRMEISGERGTVIVSEEDITTWQFADERPEDERIRHEFARKGKTAGGSTDPKAISHEGHQRQLENMIRAIETDTPPPVDGREARKAVELILAIYLSSHEQRLVELPLREDPEFVVQEV